MAESTSPPVVAVLGVGPGLGAALVSLDELVSRSFVFGVKDRTINICRRVTSPSGRGRPLRAG